MRGAAKGRAPTTFQNRFTPESLLHQSPISNFGDWTLSDGAASFKLHQNPSGFCPNPGKGSGFVSLLCKIGETKEEHTMQSAQCMLAFWMLVTGSINTLSTKFADMQCV